MPDIVLNKSIPVKDFLAQFASMLGNSLLCELYLPTAWVITTPQICVPNRNRVYCTYLYVAHDGSIVDYQKLREMTPNFKGSSYAPSIYLWEIWEDEGSDGHTEFTLDGYMFLTDQKLEPPKNMVYPLEKMREIIMLGT